MFSRPVLAHILVKNCILPTWVYYSARFHTSVPFLFIIWSVIFIFFLTNSKQYLAVQMTAWFQIYVSTRMTSQRSSVCITIETWSHWLLTEERVNTDTKKVLLHLEFEGLDELCIICFVRRLNGARIAVVKYTFGNVNNGGFCLKKRRKIEK